MRWIPLQQFFWEIGFFIKMKKWSYYRGWIFILAPFIFVSRESSDVSSALLTIHYSPFTTHVSPLTTHVSPLTTHHSRQKKTLQLPETFFLNYNSYAYCSFAASFSAPFVPPLCVAFIEANFIFNPAIFILSLPERSFSITFFLVSSASYNTFISSQSSLL